MTIMLFLSETESAALVTEELAYRAVREALIVASQPGSTVFPAVHAHSYDPANTFTIKSGSTKDAAGVKIGSYWPGNDAMDLPRHGTTILLIDQGTGRVSAVVEAGRVNAYRTAAADAVATDALAVADADTLTVFGAGHQAFYECLALARIRSLNTINVVARNAARGQALVTALHGQGLPGSLAEAEKACRAADIIVTATNARESLFAAEWVSPGTHVSSMGADAKGKQELPVALLGSSGLFCDLPAQSLRIGEFQHVADLVADNRTEVTAIGDVLTGARPGRVNDTEVTIFDSSGIALQDLYIARALLGIDDQDAS